MKTDKYGAWPKTIDELVDYIKSQDEREDGSKHDYNSIAEALTNVTVATFNYFASHHGMTGFQASWAGLQFLKVTRNLEGPFGIIDGSKMLYPQYNLKKQLDEWMEEWKPQIGKMDKEQLEERSGLISPGVLARWKELAKYAPVEEKHS